MKYTKTNNYGFTIVELIVVIVVIAVLAALTIVSYAGISQHSKQVALQSEVTNAVEAIVAYKTPVPGSSAYGAYPATLSAAKITFNSAYTVDYTPTVDGSGYCIDVTDGTNTYYAYSPQSTVATGTCDSWQNSNPIAVAAPTVSLSATSTVATLSWASVTHGTGYTVQRDTVNTFNSANLTTTSVAQASGTIQTTSTGFAPATTYYYRVETLGNGSVTSSWSNITSNTSPPLNAPTGVAATGSTSSTLSWTFNSVAGAVSYNYQLVKTSACTTAIGSGNITTTTPSSSGLVNGAIYCYRVQAVASNATTSAWSSYAQGITGMLTPSAPTVSTVNLTSLTVSWPAVPNTDHYDVYNNTTGQQLTTTGTSITFTGLTKGTTYSFKVRATSPDNGISPWSGSSSGTTYTDTLVTAASAGTSGNNITVLYSADMAYRLDLQTDGNLVIYQNSTNTPQWNKGSIGGVVNYTLNMQADCNLVMYSASTGGAVWNTNTSGVSSGCYLSLQTDNKIVIYGGGVARWWSN